MRLTSNWTPSLRQVLVLVALPLSAASPSVAQCAYEIVATLNLPPCTFPPPGLISTAINNNREVVGYFYVCGIGPTRPFIWSEETGLVFPSLPAGYFSAEFYDINDAGQITGIRTTGFTGLGNEAILYEDGQWTGLGTFAGGDWSEGLAINNAGTIAGFWGNTVSGPSPQACKWERETLINLNPLVGAIHSVALDISESGIIVGYTSDGVPDSEAGFILDGSVTTLLPPFRGTWTAEAAGVNESGAAIVNGAPDPDLFGTAAFIVGGDTWEPIPTIAPYPFVRARRINAKGIVVGEVYSDSSSPAMVFSNGKSRLLGDLIVPSQPALHVGSAAGINDEGWIVADCRLDTPEDPEGIPFDFVTVILRPLPPAVGDLDENCEVDAADLAILLGSWGSRGGAADLNADGSVDAQDLSVLLGNWTTR